MSTLNKSYKHLFFDLDHTLWDFDMNARETLVELYDVYKLSDLGVDNCSSFIDVYTENNHRLWREYHTGVISKEQLRASRFKITFEHFGLKEEVIPHKFEEDYVNICPTKINLFPEAINVLSTLNKKYKLHIITNGFQDSSELKIGKTGLKSHFENVFISEVIGIYKPDAGIFNHALNIAGAKASESLMIGDSIEADITGAKNAGMDQVYFNPNAKSHDHEVTYEINHLNELLKIL